MRNKSITLAAAALACFYSSFSSAQLLKVDINKNGESKTNSTAPGYLPWPDIANQQTTRSFTNVAGGIISCTVSQTVPPFGTPNTGFKADWGNKDGNDNSSRACCPNH